MNKKGLSPVIATVLLISITLVLAVIIFIWAKSFIGERAQKFEEPIENSCDNIKFNAEYIGGEIKIVNQGNVPLWGLEVREKGFGSLTESGTFDEQTISSGETGRIDTGVLSGEVVLVPIILGESGGEAKAYTCDDSYGLTITA